MKLNKIAFLLAIILFLIFILIASSDEGIINEIIWLILILLAGHNVFLGAIKDVYQSKILSEFFLMTLSTIGAFLLEYYEEAALIMLIYNFGELIQKKAVEKAKAKIEAANKLKIKEAIREKSNGNTQIISPMEIEEGDILLFKNGEMICVDGELLSENMWVDMSSITGESKPVFLKKGDNVLSGSICMETLAKIKARKKFEDSNIYKILIEVEASLLNKSKYEKFIRRFSKKYVPVVVLIALAIFIFPIFLDGDYNYKKWLYRSLVVLMISCPCAFLVSIPLSYFLGIGALSKKGIISKGSEFIDLIAKSRKVFFDKTGTLTKNVLKIQKVEALNGYSKDQILILAKIAESISNHPIAKAIVGESAFYPIDNFSAKEIPGEGIIAQIKDEKILIGSKNFLKEKGININNFDKTNFIEVYVAKNSSLIGRILLEDEIKEGAKNLGEELRKYKIKKVAILTGDNFNKAEKIAREIKADLFYAELKPFEKSEIIINEKRNSKEKIIYVGDGLNDAVAISNADIGVSLGKLSSDLSMKAADVSILDDNPKKIIEMILTSRKIFSIVIQNTVIAISIKAIVMIFGLLGDAKIWQALAADVGATIVVILNSLRIIKT